MNNYINPWSVAEHDLYVSNGWCPSIHFGKSWCNGYKGHEGDHWAPSSTRGGSAGPRLTWTSKEEHPKPKEVNNA